MKHPAFQARFSVLAVAFAATLPVFAQSVAPDAGQTLREMQQQPAPALPRSVPSLVVPADADTQADPGQTFPVTAVRIEGNVGIATSELQPLVDSVVGREASLGELRQAASRITALYRERGYVVARGFVPAQKIEDGIVLITVLEGRLQSSTVHNSSAVTTGRLDAIVAAQKLEGKVIQSAHTDRELLLLADLPGVGKVDGTLKPGQEVGTSDLHIAVAPGKLREGGVSVDNFGNRYTGSTRLNGNIDFNSPLGLGDRLALRATVTDEKLLYGRAAYDLPANNQGLRTGAALSSSRYELGREFAALDAQGTAHTASLYATFPAVRGLNANVWLTGSLDYRKLSDDVRSTGTETRKSATVASFESHGDFADSIGGGAYSTWHVSAALGRLAIDTPAALAIDGAGPRTNGGYRKLGLAATRLQAITPRTSALVSLSGQLASKNLDSSEKFVVGGVYGVRAYPQGEGAGDEGWLANAELQHDFAAGIQGSVFMDAGKVSFNHSAFAAGANSQTLKGWGTAVGARHRDFSLKMTLAWRLGGQPAQTAPDRKPRAWLMAGWSF